VRGAAVAEAVRPGKGADFALSPYGLPIRTLLQRFSPPRPEKTTVYRSRLAFQDSVNRTTDHIEGG